MKNGRFLVTFTTTNGYLGEGICMFRANDFVGADFMHSYYGKATHDGEKFKLVMHCRRHSPDFTPVLPLPEQFDVHWEGIESSDGFEMQTTLPGGVEMTAKGSWRGGE